MANPVPAEREGIAPQVRNFVREAEQERGREKGRGSRPRQGIGAIGNDHARSARLA